MKLRIEKSRKKITEIESWFWKILTKLMFSLADKKETQITKNIWSSNYNSKNVFNKSLTGKDMGTYIFMTALFPIARHGNNLSAH